jgi:uncharacterized membrane protein SpoIIM required for sporulation
MTTPEVFLGSFMKQWGLAGSGWLIAALLITIPSVYNLFFNALALIGFYHALTSKTFYDMGCKSIDYVNSFIIIKEMDKEKERKPP